MHSRLDPESPKNTCFFLLMSACFLGVLSLLFAMKGDRLKLLLGYVSSPALVLLNLFPCVLLVFFLFALTGRAAFSFLLTGAVVMGFTWTGWFKLEFRSDPLLAEDLLLVREAGDMAGKYQLFLPFGLVFTVFCLVLGTFLLARFAKWRPPRNVRLGTLGAALALCVPLRTLYFSDTVYAGLTRGRALENRWDATWVYQSKGFVYPFLHSFRSVGHAAPDGYQEEEAETRLSEDQNADIPEERKINIIAVMLESFCDFSDVPNAPTLAEDVYGPYHLLEWEGISGKLVTNIFAGGTVDSERSFLTGYPVLPPFREPVNSFVWYLQGQGYHTTGSHPGNAWFYRREEVNRDLGFQDYLFLENYYGELAEGGIAPDDVLFPELLRLAEEEEGPYFSFSVSYQGHGPYPDDENVWGGEFIENNGYSESEYHILNNYFGSVANTVKNLAALADGLRKSREATVLLVFGDHKPWLGDKESVYRALGMPVGCETDEGFLCHYSTQYLIWGNDAAKERLGSELCGQGPAVAPSMLMEVLFDALSWEGPPFLQRQRELRQSGVTMYHSAAGNVLYCNALYAPDELPKAVHERLRHYLCDAYYEQTHFRYSALLEEARTEGGP